MSEVSERLAEVLTGHPGSERGGRGAWCVKCYCGYDTPAMPYPGDAWEVHRAHVADTLAERVEQMLAEARAEALRGVIFRVEVACDGYGALTEGDVPEGTLCVEDYIAGAAEAAREIRGALRADAAEREAR